MKIPAFILFSLLLSSLAFGTDNAKKPSPEMKWLSFDKGLEQAKTGKKKILVDVYTDWCGWCKKMDKEVFNHELVAPYLSNQYVLIKLNAESDAAASYKNQKTSERGLAQAFGVTGYPTLLFLESNGEYITPLPGYVKAEDFLPILKYFSEDHYKTKQWNVYLEEYKKETAKKIK